MCTCVCVFLRKCKSVRYVCISRPVSAPFYFWCFYSFLSKLSVYLSVFVFLSISVSQVAFYAVQHLPPFLEFLVNETHNHFSHSSVRRDEYQNLHVAMTGKKAKRVRRNVKTRFLALGDAVAINVEQWDPLAQYFKGEAAKNPNAPDSYVIQQLNTLYSPKNKAVMTLLSDRLGRLNQLNKLFQGEQPNQAKLLDNLLSYFYGLLDDVLTREGVQCVKASSDPFSVDLRPFRKPPTAIHFGFKSK